MNSEPAEAVPWEELDGRQMMTPGDRVILTTEGERHLGYIRPIAGMVTRTWVGFDVETYRVQLDQVTLRNPRESWGNPWLFMLGCALLLAEKGDPSYTWLKPDLNSTEPFDLEMGAVLMEALQDLR